MDLGSPDKNLEEMSDLHNDYNSSVGKLDLNLAMSKEGPEVWSDKSELDYNKQEYHGASSLHTDGRFERPESPYIKPSSPAQFELDHDQERRKNFDYSRESLQSPPNETLVVSGRCSDKSSSPAQPETFHNELEIGDSAHCSVKSPLTVDFNYQQEVLEKDNSPHKELKKISSHFSGQLQYEKTESAYEVIGGGGTGHLTGKSCNGNETIEHIYNSGKSKSDSRQLEGRKSLPHSPGRTPKRSASPVRQMSLSPERASDKQEFAGQKPSSSPQDVPGLSYSTRSSRRKHSTSPEGPGGDGKRVLSPDHLPRSARRSPTSPGRRSRRDSPHRDDPVRKRRSTSPRRRHSPSDLRRQDKSVSSTRPKDSYSGYGRDYRDKSRSRSPYARDHYRRSPRRRYSPRRKSPPSGYHSRRRSPRRRPWSPPPNRSTGVGRPGNNLFVAGFSFLTTERDLERKFSRFGRVKDVRIVRDKRSGDSRGFGFLSLERDEDADAAIRALDQTEWNGRVVLVEKSKSH